MQQTQEKDLKKTALELVEENQHRKRLLEQTPVRAVEGQACDMRPKPRMPDLSDKEALAQLVEKRLVGATWTLRRLPDRERGFLHMRGALWPEMMAEAGSYPAAPVSSVAARSRVRLSPKEIDQMQPALDLLTLLPDILDRQILFWTAWHQDGEVQARVPWAKVRRSLGVSASRWTLKRRYEAGLQWLGALVALQR